MPKTKEQLNAERISFVREGETLNKNNFATLMNRFISESFAPARKREENESELHYIQHVKEPHKANALRADVFMDKLIEMLTPEQKMELVQNAPAEAQRFVRKVIEMKMESMARSTSEYYKKKEQATAMGPGPEKDRLEAEVDAFDQLVDRVKKGNYTLEQAKNLYKTYLTNEQLNDPDLNPANHVSTRFIIDAHEYVSDKVADMLTPSQIQELGETVDNYVVPWDREPEEMGETVYDRESKKAKADIDAMKDLSPEQKEKMKADIDAANDFLRQPNKRDDPESIYDDLTKSYENAVKHDGERANKVLMAKEGLQFDVLDKKLKEDTLDFDFFIKEGKEEEYKKWQETEFKFSEGTKASIKHVFGMMQQYGYGGKGVIGEQSIKQYGLSMLAGSIFAYKDAIKSGDATKIAEASKAMVEEKEHVNEILGYIREHFPVDRHSDNFAKAGNVDVTRNGTFPPQYRFDQAVSTFNSLFMIMNFAEANGISPEEFLEKPAHYIRDFYYNKGNIGLNNVLKGKTGGEALFEASKATDKLLSVSPLSGAVRIAEGMNFLDMDPSVRLHNHGLSDFFDTDLVRNATADINRRVVAYKQGHLDRFLYVTEPRDNASLLGVPIYNIHKKGYDQPEAFNEAEYLQNNGKSVAEMKEIFDKNVKEYLLLSATRLFRDSKGKVSTYPAFGTNGFVEIAQQAASKILMAKYAERYNDPAYDALKGVLTDGEKYVKDLVQEEKTKLQEARNQLEQAKKDGNQPEIDRLQAYIDANKAYEDINVKVTEPQQKYAQTLESFEKKLAEFRGKERPAGVDLKPHEDFNKAMVAARKEVADLDVRIDARRNELTVNRASYAKDDEMQILEAAKAAKLAEIEGAKKDYLSSLQRDVEEGRITAHFKEMREDQINSPTYKYNSLPGLFQKSAEIMSKDQYLAGLADSARAEGVNWADYDDADKDALYDVYVQEQNALQDPEIADFVLKQDAQAFGFVKTEPEAPKAEEIVAEKAEEKVEEKVTDFTGRWFEPGTKPSKEAFIAKFHDVEKQQTLEPQGNNWLEKCQSKEAAKNELDRLRFFYNEALQVLSPEGRQAVFEALTPGSQKSAVNFAKDRYAALLKEKSPEAKEVAKNFNKMSLEDVKKAAEPYLTREEKKDPKLVPHNHIASYYLMARDNPNVWKPIFDNLSEQQFNDLAYRTESYKAPLERSLDEVSVEKYGKEFDSVKDVLKDMQYYKGEELTEERRAEIEGKLDKAKGFMADLDKEYDSALSTIRTNREEYEPGMNYERSHVAFEILKKEGIDVKLGGNKGTTILFNGFKNQTVDYKTVQGSDYEAEQVLEKYDEQYKKLRERKIQMRSETKDAIKNIFAKFDQYGFDQGEFNPEEGGKIYGLQRYAKARGEMEEKLASNDPIEKVKAVEAAEKMITEYNHAKEIIDMAKDAFGVDKGGFYSGNMDVERNGAFPPEFRSDLAGVSALNGLYVMYRSLKEQNVDMDAFLDDPGAYLNAETKKILEENHVDSTIKGKSGADAIADICTSYAHTAEVQRFRLGRAMETLAKLETDPEMARNNMASEYAYTVTGQNELLFIKARDDIVQEGNRSFDNFLIVKEPQQDASLACFPTYDFDTMRVRPVREFDEMDYLAHLQETPQEYVDRILLEGGKTLAWTQPQLMCPLSKSDVIKMMQKASIKYLLAHPELDKRSDAYKALKDIVEKGPTAIEERLRTMKGDKKFEDALKGLDMEKIDFDNLDSIEPSKTFDKFAKSSEMKNFGEDVRLADKNANREFSNLQAQLNRAEAEMERATTDFAVDMASQKKLELEGQLEKAIADRKEQLLKDFRAGKITEEYFNRRNLQLDNGKFDNVPKMFEADELKSKNDYLKEYAKRFENPSDFNELSKEEKNELYQRYVDNAKIAKHQFIAKKYLESEGLRQKFEQKTMAERIAERDARPERAGEAPIKGDAEKAKAVEKKNEIEQVAIDENEPEVKEEKLEEKVEEKVEVKEEEEKVEEKVVGEDGGEQVSIGLDDEEPEMNDDMLNFGGNEKDLVKDKDALNK